MSVSFKIFPDRGLVVVTYQGEADTNETMRAFAEYTAHPDFQPGHKQLIDLTQITGYKNDFVRLMEMQAIKAQSIVGNGMETLMVYLAPTAISQSMGTMITKSWDDVDDVVPLIQHSAAEALALLGQPETTMADLMARLD